MLVEAKLAVGSQDPRGLVQRAAGVGNAAKDAGQHHCVDRRAGKRQPLGDAVDHLYGDRRSLCSLERALAQDLLGLNRDQFAHRRRVVGERHAAPGADLDHPTGEPGQQLPTTLGASPALLGGAGPSLDVGEQSAVHGWFAADRELAARVRHRLGALGATGSPTPPIAAPRRGRGRLRCGSLARRGQTELRP